jgi:uncharacterized protein (TIGR02246 family)
MRRAWAFAALVWCGIFPALWADSASDAKAISARGRDFVAAWNRDDAHGMAALWAPEGDFVSPFGEVANGRGEVEKLLAGWHSTTMKGTTFQVTRETVRLFGPNAGLMDWDVELQGLRGPDGQPAPLKLHVTTVVARQGGKWWVEAARPVVFVPAPAGGK